MNTGQGVKELKNLKIVIFVLIASFVAVSSYLNKYEDLKKEIENTAMAKEALLNRHVDLSCGFIDVTAIYADDYLSNDIQKDSALFSQLAYNPEQKTYNLDIVNGHRDTGNLTGLGEIPAQGPAHQELNMALELNRLFAGIYKKIPDVAWLYYTSSSNFIYMYPWISSGDFSFNDNLKNEKFFAYAAPDRNPAAKAVWTPAYVDHAGKGLMVTLSRPVYYQGTFMGVISLDITNHLLNEMLRSDYDIYLIDDTDSVLANSMNIQFVKDVPKLCDFINTSQGEVNEMKHIQDKSLHRAGSYYIYAVALDNAPWQMVMRVPVKLIAGKAAWAAFPVFISCLLLLFMVFEVEKRIKTEIQLRKSFEELTSIHTLLENAAKYDFLTNTVNRRGFEEIFNQSADLDSAIIIGDMDYFKVVNDTYGHAAGDQVLTEIAGIMKESVREYDIVCRWGGEEFIIVLYNRTHGEVMQFAEALRKKIASQRICLNKETEIYLTMTFGVVEHHAGENVEASISKADEALYMGKRNGRNQVVAYQLKG